MRSALLLLFLCGACTDAPVATPAPPPSPSSKRDAAAAAPSPFVIANWNLEWFGSTAEGPSDEELQFANVTKVMRSVRADLWSVQEIIDVDALRRLGAEVGGYESLASSEEAVESGSTVYRSATALKLGIVYRPERVEVRGARVILTSDLAPFNGRAPLEIDLSTKPGGTALTMVVVHLSPGGDAASYEKRKTAAALLKGHLDAKPSGSLVIVAGDFNDGLEKSSFEGSETPFSGFLNDAAYTFATRGLESPRYPFIIDHQLVTDDLAASLVAGSAGVVNGDTLIQSYIATTSDHDPVTAAYDLP